MPDKILLIGDYSNCQTNLAFALRKLGYEVTLATSINYLSACKYPDINISRQKGVKGKLEYFFNANLSWKYKFRGYDIVVVHDPHFLSLKPHRLHTFFESLKRYNGKVFYNAMSNDIRYHRMCEDKDSPLKYNEWFINGKPSLWLKKHQYKWKEWHDASLIGYQEHFFDNIDGATAVLFEYFEGLRFCKPKTKIGYCGIPINTQDIPFRPPVIKDKVKVLIAVDSHRSVMKGSDLLESAISDINKRYPNLIEVKIAQDLPFIEFCKIMLDSHVVVDQVYSYSPATTALLGMAMGKTVVSGGEDIFYDFIGEKENRPIINAIPDLDQLTLTLEKYLLDKEFIESNAYKSRDFVIQHNEASKVAKRCIDLWYK